MRTTLETYSSLVDAAGVFNRLAIRLKNEEITMKQAHEEAQAKIRELADRFA